MTCEEGPSRKTLSCCGTESGEYSNHLDFMCVFFHPLPPKVLPKQKLGGKVLRGGVSQTADETGGGALPLPPFPLAAEEIYKELRSKYIEVVFLSIFSLAPSPIRFSAWGNWSGWV